MRRVDLGRIGQCEQLVVERVVEHPRHLLGRVAFGARKIGPAHVADEERVAGEGQPWLF